MSDIPDGYKMTEVGVIPEDWVIDSLDSMTSKIGSGITPTGGSRIYTDFGHVFIRSQNIGWGSLLLDDVVFISNETHETFKGTEIELGDVFLNITGASIGRSAVADERIIGGNVNQHVCIIRVIPEKLYPLYLNLFLLSNMGQRQIDSFQAGGNRQGLNFAQIRSFQLPLPPTLHEQRAIAAALSEVDEEIAALDGMIAKKRDIKQGAMQELLTGQRRLPGFSGEWETRQLGALVSLCRDQINPMDYPDQLFLHFSLPAYDNGKIPTIELGFEIRSNKFRVPADAILISKLNPRIPRVWAPNNLPEFAVASTEFLVLLAKHDITKEFLFVICSWPMFQSQLEASTTGTTGSHQRIHSTDVLAIEISYPSLLDEQNAISNCLFDMTDELAALEEQREKTIALKQGMMQELLTGQTRLV